MNQEIRELYQEILEKRIARYREDWENTGDYSSMAAMQAYQSALDMFLYAERNDFASLVQFDY